MGVRERRGVVRRRQGKYIYMGHFIHRGTYLYGTFHTERQFNVLYINKSKRINKEKQRQSAD